MASKENLPPKESESSQEIVRTSLLPISTALLEGYYVGGHTLRNRKRPSAENSSSNSKNKKRDPEDIFRKGSFASSKMFAQKARKWLMVHIEKSILTSESQLERILRENNELKHLITENFVLWHDYQSSKEGRKYTIFYQPVQYPYLAILDPASGNSLKVLHSLDMVAVYEFVTEFLSTHQRSAEESPGASKPPSDKKQTGHAHDTEMDTSDGTSVTKKLSKLNILEDGKKTDWMAFLGGDRDPKIDFVLRLPDGERREISWPGTSTLKSLCLYAEELGYGMKEYEIIAVRPRRCLTVQDLKKTLEEVLFPREVIFLQLKSN